MLATGQRDRLVAAEGFAFFALCMCEREYVCVRVRVLVYLVFCTGFTVVTVSLHIFKNILYNDITSKLSGRLQY